jgi:hypothetical protein
MHLESKRLPRAARAGFLKKKEKDLAASGAKLLGWHGAKRPCWFNQWKYTSEKENGESNETRRALEEICSVGIWSGTGDHS